MVLRPRILRLAVALIFVALTAIAGYALAHGLTRDAVPSEIWRVIFGITGLSALMRIAGPSSAISAV